VIRYSLACDQGHGFEAWFGSSTAYDKQARGHEIACPACGSARVRKAPMAPALARGRAEPMAPEQSEKPSAPTYAVFRELRAQLKANADDVGAHFPEEARKMHFGEVAPRSIYGQATLQEARELRDEGIPVCPLPPLPEDHN
jgi:hypothetical protein